MTDLAIGVIKIDWSKAGGRWLSTMAGFDRPGSRTKPAPFHLHYQLTGAGVRIKVTDTTYEHDDITPDERNTLGELLSARSSRVVALLRGFYEGSLRNGRLPHIPLNLVRLEFGDLHSKEIRAATGSGRGGPPHSFTWLSADHMPMRAQLLNMPGAPFGWLTLSWTADGQLLGVRDTSLQRRRGHTQDPLAIMSKAVMDADTARRYLRGRYEPAVAVDLLADLELVGSAGHRLGLALLEVLS